MGKNINDNSEYTKTITATELKKNLGKYLDYINENNEVVKLIEMVKPLCPKFLAALSPPRRKYFLKL